ncbi:MAG: hypothetical protein U0V70_03980 [Terriglobia bacterium]
MPGKIEPAIESFQKAIQLNQKLAVKSAWPYLNLGELLLKQNRIPESLASIEHALLIHPQWSKALVSLGKAQLQMGKTEEARSNFLAAIRGPGLRRSPLPTGQLYRRLGQKEKAQNWEFFKT